MMLASNPTRTLGSFYDQLAIPITFFWLVRAIGPTRSDIRWLIIAGGWTVVVQATIGIVSWTVPSLLPAQWLGRAGDRTVGTFGGPAAFTVTLVLFALLALYAAMSTGRSRTRLVLFGVVVMAQFGVRAFTLARQLAGRWPGDARSRGGLSTADRWVRGSRRPRRVRARPRSDRRIDIGRPGAPGGRRYRRRTNCHERRRRSDDPGPAGSRLWLRQLRANSMSGTSSEWAIFH